MGTPSTQALAGWVKDTLRSEEWIALDAALLEAVTARWTGQSEDAISEFVEEKLPFVAEHLRDEVAAALVDGAVCPFEIDQEELRYVRKLGAQIDTLLAKLRKVCPYAFENVCAKLLEKLGGESQVTGKSGDGGIDFVSVGVDILPAGISSPIQCRAAVIGQAKRYTSKLIAEKSLREFVGASIIQRNTLRIQQKISPLTPVLLAFWTTANFEPNSKAFARKAGVWLMDGHTISAYLSTLGLTDWVMSLEDAPEREPVKIERAEG